MPDEPAPPAPGPRAQTDVVIDGVRAMIRDGELRPGARLPAEKPLADRLGVSRGPLREGVRALAALGVLETRQGDGTYVTALDAHRLLEPVSVLADLASDADALHLLTVRRVLEAEAAGLAAERPTGREALVDRLSAVLDEFDALAPADRAAHVPTAIDIDSRFHRLVAEGSGNPALAALVGHLVSRTARARTWRALQQRDAMAAAHAEHRAVVAEIARGSGERARLRMSVHVLGVEEYLAGHVVDPPPGRTPA